MSTTGPQYIPGSDSEGCPLEHSRYLYARKKGGTQASIAIDTNDNHLFCHSF